MSHLPLPLYRNLSKVLLLMLLISIVSADMERRAVKKAHPVQDPTLGKPADMFMFLQPRNTLAFDDSFNLTRSIPNTHFSLMHMSQRSTRQKDEKSWAPGDGNTQNKPVSFFHDACLETEAGKRWKAAWSGRLDLDTSAYLVIEYGVFGLPDGKGHAAWNWLRDGNLAVSCQYTAIKNSALINPKGVDPAAFSTVLESSRQMIANLNRMFGWHVEYFGPPVRSRDYLEALAERQRAGRNF